MAKYLRSGEQPADQIDLLAIPAERLQLAPIPLQATLQEALLALRQDSVEALYVLSQVRGEQRIYGVLTSESVESAYRF